MPLSRQTLETLYQTMVRIRRFDEKTVELFNAGQVKGTAHSYVGQEAVATGACANLTKDDSVISNHRGHGHCIAKGARLDFMMAELMGRVSFGAAVYLILTSELPSPAVARLMDAILVSSVDHGATPPSVLAARTVASSGASLSASVAASNLSSGTHSVAMPQS